MTSVRKCLSLAVIVLACFFPAAEAATTPQGLRHTISPDFALVSGPWLYEVKWSRTSDQGFRVVRTEIATGVRQLFYTSDADLMSWDATPTSIVLLTGKLTRYEDSNREGGETTDSAVVTVDQRSLTARTLETRRYDWPDGPPGCGEEMIQVKAAADGGFSVASRIELPLAADGKCPPDAPLIGVTRGSVRHYDAAGSPAGENTFRNWLVRPEMAIGAGGTTALEWTEDYWRAIDFTTGARGPIREMDQSDLLPTAGPNGSAVAVTYTSTYGLQLSYFSNPVSRARPRTLVKRYASFESGPAEFCGNRLIYGNRTQMQLLALNLATGKVRRIATARKYPFAAILCDANLVVAMPRKPTRRTKAYGVAIPLPADPAA